MSELCLQQGYLLADFRLSALVVCLPANVRVHVACAVWVVEDAFGVTRGAESDERLARGSRTMNLNSRDLNHYYV